MRASAILIGISALFLGSCSIIPHTPDNKAELAKIKGPDVGSVEGSMLAQAAQATDAGDHKRAAQIYSQLADRFPQKNEYRLKLAESLRRAGENEVSLHIVDALIAKDPKNAAAYEDKGLALMNTGELAEAGNAFGEAMKLDPKRWRTLNGVGILFTMKGKYDSAIAYYQAALNISTDNPSVLNNAALTYAIDKQYDRSYDTFARARRHLDPGSADLKHLDLNMALVYAIDGKLDEAERAAAPHLSKEGLYNNMGFYSYLAKNNELAKGYLNMALTQSPTYYERAWKNLGALTGDVAAGDPVQAVPGTDLQASLRPEGALPLASVPASAPAEVSLSDIPESNSAKLEAASPSSGKPGRPPKTAKDDTDAPRDNPDIVLLKKPKVAAVNSDWDAKQQDNIAKGGAASGASGN